MMCNCYLNAKNSRKFSRAGLFLASLALGMAASAKRLAPEPLGFALRCLRSALPAPDLPPFHPASSWLRPAEVALLLTVHSLI